MSALFALSFPLAAIVAGLVLVDAGMRWVSAFGLLRRDWMMAL